jgi:hypothetical protein
MVSVAGPFFMNKEWLEMAGREFGGALLVCRTAAGQAVRKGADEPCGGCGPDDALD